MKLRLTDGRMVEAEKDCSCLDTIHNGPHWIYLDGLDRQRNEKLRTAGNIRGYIVVEWLRLSVKRHEMTRRGIVEIIREVATNR